jgi:hypothetical protein
VLRARERAPIPSSVVVRFRFIVKSIKELGGASDHVLENLDPIQMDETTKGFQELRKS